MSDKVIELVNRMYSTIVDHEDGAFSQWINGLWGWFPNLSYEEQKEAFLYLLRRLLDDGKVYLQEPADAQYGEKRVLNADVWAAPHDHMIEYIRRYWPEGIEDANDIRLTDYWYDIHCPRILWFDEEENRLIGS